MMNRKLDHDDMQFDRLVDGELSSADRRRLLASLDERPDGWRRCALAFLEAQSWKNDLGKLLREPSPARAADELASDSAATRRPLPWRLTWLALAASVMVALTLTLLKRDGGNPITSNAPMTTGHFAEVPVSPAPAATDSALADDALTLWVRDDAGQARPLRVPLVDAGALDRRLGVTFQSAIPSSTRERLQERGYDVQSKRRYAPFWLENGRPMIVPVEDTKIVPVSQNVY